MQTATRVRRSTSAPGDGSRTMTITNDPTQEEDECTSDGGQPVGTLRLRVGPRKHRNRVAWNENVVDNEGAGRKKSKICCIYHKPKRYDESSSESDESSDEEAPCGHNHSHNPSHNHPAPGPSQQSSQSHSLSEVHMLEPSEPSEPNAYEKPHKGKRKAT